MSNKIGSILEKYIDKAVIAISGVVCLWLLITQVIISPNKVEYAGKNFHVDQIDDKIFEEARTLEQSLIRNPEPKEPYEPKSERFLTLMESPIKDFQLSHAQFHYKIV